jgi:hypothetical protein
MRDLSPSTSVQEVDKKRNSTKRAEKRMISKINGGGMPPTELIMRGHDGSLRPSAKHWLHNCIDSNSASF